jgi:acetyl/propionyl-CoA carboxylase alpha subunit
MLSKIISYAPTRQEAIDIMLNGLDEYVIEGVQHNTRLCNAVLRHPSFQKGETPTSFLPTHMPDWSGVQLTTSEEEELAIAVSLVGLTRESFLERPTVAPNLSKLIIRLGGFFGSAFSVTLGDEGTATVRKISSEDSEASHERIVKIDSVEYNPSRYIAKVSLDGKKRSIQVSLFISYR